MPRLSICSSLGDHRRMVRCLPSAWHWPRAAVSTSEPPKPKRDRRFVRRSQDRPNTSPRPRDAAAAESRTRARSPPRPRSAQPHGRRLPQGVELCRQGTVHLLAESGNQKITTRRPISRWRSCGRTRCAWQAYQAMLVCDGQKVHPPRSRFPTRCSSSTLPRRLTMKRCVDRPDPGHGDGRASAARRRSCCCCWRTIRWTLLRDAEEPVLIEPGQIEGRDCYRVRIRRPDGIGRVLDRSGDVRVAADRPAHRRAAPANEPEQADRQALAGGRFPGARSTARSIPRRLRSRCPRGRRW